MKYDPMFDLGMKYVPTLDLGMKYVPMVELVMKYAPIWERARKKSVFASLWLDQRRAQARRVVHGGAGERLVVCRPELLIGVAKGRPRGDNP